MEQFSAEGKEIIYTAHQIVTEHQQQEIEPEHLLLSILKQEKSVFVSFLIKSLKLLISPLQSFSSKSVSAMTPLVSL